VLRAPSVRLVCRVDFEREARQIVGIGPYQSRCQFTQLVVGSLLDIFLLRVDI
jgi:hypothetical protein